MRILVLALASCAIGGTLDNVPGQSPATVTKVSPGGPESAGRPECPASMPASSCPQTSRYDCQPNQETGCVVCTCTSL
jgi:hypothetical protein